MHGRDGALLLCAGFVAPGKDVMLGTKLQERPTTNYEIGAERGRSVGGLGLGGLVGAEWHNAGGRRRRFLSFGGRSLVLRCRVALCVLLDIYSVHLAIRESSELK